MSTWHTLRDSESPAMSTAAAGAWGRLLAVCDELVRVVLADHFRGVRAAEAEGLEPDMIAMPRERIIYAAAADGAANHWPLDTVLHVAGLALLEHDLPASRDELRRLAASWCDWPTPLVSIRARQLARRIVRIDSVLRRARQMYLDAIAMVAEAA